MDSRQKIIIIFSICVIAALAVLGVATKKKGGVAGSPENGKMPEGTVEIRGAFSPVVPERVELTKPAQASPVREGASEKLGIFNIEVSKSGYSPAQIAAAQGDIVQILIRAADGRYDFEIPYVGIYKAVEKGDEGMISFEATDAGTLVFQCRDYCPEGGGKGLIVIKQKGEQ